MKYKVRDPQGQMHIIEGPEGATPDQVIAQAQRLVPQQKPMDWKQTISSAAKGAITKPASALGRLMTNPETMANAMPTALGAAGGFSPIPGGATLGTGLGQGMRDISLKALGKPIPGMMQHGLELGGAVIGDVAAIPAMKRAYYGGKIGEVEKAAGVVTRAPTKAVTPGSVGQTLNDLEAQIDAGAINTPQLAKDAKAVVSQIYKNPKIYEQTGEISVQAARVSKKVQDLLNQIPGRAGPAKALGQAMTIPNAIKKGYTSMPWAVRRGAEGALGAGIGWEVVKKMLGL